VTEDASPKERFAAAAALYHAWATALCESIERYFFGMTKAEIQGVAAGIDLRANEIEALNAERIALLEEIYVFCLDVDDSLPKVMEPRLLSNRVLECCSHWRKRATDLLHEAATLETERTLGELSEAQRAGVEGDLEKKLEQALLDHHGEDEGEGEEEGEGDDEEEDEEGEDSSNNNNDGTTTASPLKMNEEKLKQMEDRSAALAAEREHMTQQRKKSKTENVLLRVSSAMEVERKAYLEAAISIAESPRIVEESMAFLKEQENKEDEEEKNLAKATVDEGAVHRAEIEKLKEKNEGLVQRLTELSQKGGEEEGGTTKVEHRAEIEKLKQEGESLKGTKCPRFFFEKKK
jgi:hypothetical protein